jgi:hypothetical protein
MNNKEEILSKLSTIFKDWQDQLASLSEEQITQPLSPSHWTIKDVVAHLWFWQEASVARAEAAINGKDPSYPEWWELFGPDPNDDVDRTNAWNYERCKDRSWQKVYTDWSSQFARYLELLRKIPEKDLVTPGRYEWMGVYALADSAMGSYDHHQEHMEMLTDWLHTHGQAG